MLTLLGSVGVGALYGVGFRFWQMVHQQVVSLGERFQIVLIGGAQKLRVVGWSLVVMLRRTKGAARQRAADDNWKQDDMVRCVMRENVAAGLWVASLIAAGTLVLTGLPKACGRKSA